MYMPVRIGESVDLWPTPMLKSAGGVLSPLKQDWVVLSVGSGLKSNTVGAQILVYQERWTGVSGGELTVQSGSQTRPAARSRTPLEVVG